MRKGARECSYGNKKSPENSKSQVPAEVEGEYPAAHNSFSVASLSAAYIPDEQPGQA